MLRLGLTHGDGAAKLNPGTDGIVARLVDETDAALVGVAGANLGANLGTTAEALLYNHVGAWEVSGLVFSVNDELDVRHDCQRVVLVAAKILRLPVDPH